MGTHPIFESDFDCLTEWTIWQTEKKRTPKLTKKTQIDEKGDEEEENLDQLIDMVRSIDVESAIRKEKLVDLDSRTEFAAQLEEIESKIGEESDVSRLEADIHVDSRVPPEGRERFLRARCRVLQEEVNRLQKAANQAQEKFHRTKRTEQEKTDALAKSDKNAEKCAKNSTNSDKHVRMRRQNAK